MGLLRKKSLKILVFLLILVLNIGCSQSPEQQAAEARKELNAEGIVFNEKSFLEAVANNDQRVLELLLKAGYDPNVIFRFGDAFALKNHPEFTSDERKTLLLIMNMNDLMLISNVITRANKGGFISSEAASKMMNISTKLSMEGTSLMFASMQGNIDIVRLLLSRKADPNKIGHDPSTGRNFNALVFAIQELHPEIVELLLKNKADPKAKDTELNYLFTNSGIAGAQNRINMDKDKYKQAYLDKIKAILKSYY